MNYILPPDVHSQLREQLIEIRKFITECKAKINEYEYKMLGMIGQETLLLFQLGEHSSQTEK